jgi:outer membrane protein assembly factor BamB
MTPKNRLALKLSALVLLLPAHLATAQDWPQWRGVNRDGKVSGFKPPKEWPKELTQKWKVTVGEGVSTPSLVGDKLYVFSRESGSEILRCLDATSGKELWQNKYESLGATGPASGFSGPRSSPTVAEGKVVTLGIRGVLSCLNAADGKPGWIKDENKGYPRFFISSSPLIVDGLCIAQLGGADNGAVVAYGIDGAREKWKWGSDSPAYASPVMISVGGSKLIIAETETKIAALNASDGKLVWETPFAVPGRGYNASTPVVDGDTLIFAGSGRGVTAVKLEKKGDEFTAKELWKNMDNSVMFNTPVLKDGLLFGLSAGNDLFCIQTRDGKTAWTAPTSKSAPAAEGPAEGAGRGRGGRGRGGYGSIVDAGPALFALTPASELIAFAPGEKAYTELARYKVSETSTYAYPVVSGNRIFIKDQDAVILFVIP